MVAPAPVEVNGPADTQRRETIASSMREWVVRSKSPVSPDDSIADRSSSHRPSSDEIVEGAARKRVESFEVDFGGISHSNSSGSIGEKCDQMARENLFRKSCDCFSKDEDLGPSRRSREDTAVYKQKSTQLPPLRPRLRSTEAIKIPGSPVYPILKSLKRIDENEEEHSD